MESEKQEETKIENKETNVENSNNNPTEIKIFH